MYIIQSKCHNNQETGSSKRDHTDINPMNMQQGVRKRKKAPGKC